jgi:hypothetical protein
MFCINSCKYDPAAPSRTNAGSWPTVVPAQDWLLTEENSCPLAIDPGALDVPIAWRGVCQFVQVTCQ